ncbi:uncharacterized protein LOC128860940 [Anastrepha ludens]|nr:uncharacterized protein LOC128860940 [Anastrepha ludens]
MQSLNKNFQARNGNPTQLLSDVIVAINSLKSKIIPPNHEINILEDDLENAAVPNMYLGYAFEQKIKEAQFLSQELEIRKICMEFVKELIIQLRERLPDNIEIMQLVNLFSVQNMLKVSKSKEIFKVLEYFECKNIENIQLQIEKINFIKWEFVEDTSKFWTEVIKYKDAGNNNPFSDLAEFALKILSLPWSNAEVERIFSQMNIVKSKLRNAMSLKTLNAIMYIRYGLERHGKCCHNYVLPNEYLSQITSSEKYSDVCEADELDNILSIL